MNSLSIAQQESSHRFKVFISKITKSTTKSIIPQNQKILQILSLTLAEQLISQQRTNNLMPIARITSYIRNTSPPQKNSYHKTLKTQIDLHSAPTKQHIRPKFEKCKNISSSSNINPRNRSCEKKKKGQIQIREENQREVDREGGRGCMCNGSVTIFFDKFGKSVAIGAESEACKP